MQSDLPHTLYLREKDKKKANANANFKYNPNDPAIAKQMDAIRKRKEKMAAKHRGDIPYSTDELFK